MVFFSAWLLMALGYSVSGIHKLGSVTWLGGMAIKAVLENPLARDTFLREVMLMGNGSFLIILTYGALATEVLFLPLSIFRRTRSLIWTAGVLLHLGIFFTVDFADLTFGMLLLHLFTFDRRWLSTVRSGVDRIVVFDGACGMCNGFVKFILHEDEIAILKYSPLQGNLAHKKLGGKNTESLTTLVLIEGEKTFEQSDAILRIAWNLGGLWRAFAFVGKIIPKKFRDSLYKFVSVRRKSISSCELLMPDERTRFVN